MEIHIIDWLLYIILVIVFYYNTKDISTKERYILLLILSLIYAVIFTLLDVLELLTDLVTGILYILQIIYDNLTIKL